MVRKIAMTSGIDQLSLDEGQIAVYPNPNNGVFSVKSNESIERMEITDMLGQLIYSSKAMVTGQEASNINLTQQAKGTYFIRFTQTDKMVITKKIVLAD